MLAILYKEINGFFSTLLGYLVIGVFLLITGLFLWVFGDSYNIFDYGYADLTPFFQLVPWVFLFLIPAITMRSFSEEKKMGTLELLQVQPISTLELVLGKFMGAFVLILMALVPTLFYIYAVGALANPTGNFDAGIMLGSYVGLLFLAAAYTAIGIFASTLTTNQIVAFIIGLLICFTLYYGLDGIVNSALLPLTGMRAHYEALSRGVLDTRDLIYFLSLTALFLFFTVLSLKQKN